MGKRFLIDTNISIYFLDGNLTPSGIVFLQPLINQEINISVITKIELLGWNFPNSNKSEIHNEFVDQSNVFPLDDEIVEKTIEIRRTYKIKLPDAIIAATAIIFDLTLISRNDKDFTQIPGLKYVNPFAV
jgi:predicted nucleic acid-binding protein